MLKSREAAAIIFGIKKFHPFINGRKFTLITDHKPLTTIFSPKSSLSALAAPRLQRSYNFIDLSRILSYRKVRYNPDCLSQLPLEATTEEGAIIYKIYIFIQFTTDLTV